MSELNKLSIVPENEMGKAVDIEHHVTVDKGEAKRIYSIARNRLLNPNCWHELSGAASATFKLVSAKGGFSELALENNYLQIDIPGPGAAEGDGYDWVKIEAIEENKVPGADKSIAIKLRASSNPNNNKPGTAHFFKEDATSTFIIKLIDSTVTVSYYGRNEVPNVKDVSIIDKVRNTLVAVGAAIGLSEMQWTSLVKGFLKTD